MNRVGWMLTLAVFIGACTNRAETETPEPDETQAIPKENVVSEAQVLQQSFPRLFDYLGKEDASFTSDKFVSMGNRPLDTLKAQPVGKKLQPYYPFFIYNADSTLAIDLYSYNSVPVRRNGNIGFEKGGPDTEVALVDLKNNTRQRIFFSGPGTSVLEANWQNNETVLLAGGEEVGANALKPVVWKISLPAKSAEIFQYPDTLQASSGGYARINTPK